MMNQYEVPCYLQDALPGLKEALVKEEVLSNLFEVTEGTDCSH